VPVNSSSLCAFREALAAVRAVTRCSLAAHGLSSPVYLHVWQSGLWQAAQSCTLFLGCKKGVTEEKTDRSDPAELAELSLGPES
jgi:hypothetical protein